MNFTSTKKGSLWEQKLQAGGKTTRSPKRTSVPGALSWRRKETAELDSLSCFLPRLLLSSYYWCLIIKLSKLNIIKNFLLLRHLLIVFGSFPSLLQFILFLKASLFFLSPLSKILISHNKTSKAN